MNGLVDLTLPNVGPGPDPVSLVGLAATHEFLVVLLQRDYHCRNCRKQVRAVAARYDEFEERDVEVVSVLPESPERTRAWPPAEDLPFPLVADPDATLGSAFDQRVRLGPLGRYSDFLGRQPAAVVLDCREEPTVAWSHRGASTFDRPDVDDLLAAVDHRR